VLQNDRVHANIDKIAVVIFVAGAYQLKLLYMTNCLPPRPGLMITGDQLQTQTLHIVSVMCQMMTQP